MAKATTQSVMQTDDDTLYYERCAGIDVHKKLLVVCLRIGRKTESREYGTTTGEIREIVRWLKESGCQMVAMESTGSYWKPLYNIFEQETLPAMVVNAYHIKNVPGRKTDWNDAFWIAKCLAQGLLKPSFVPTCEQRELRDMTRFRKSQIEERSRNINHLQKFLEGANIKLGSWLSDIEGKSATQLLELIIGKPDFTIDDVKDRMHGKMHSTPEEIFAAIEGYITPTQRAFFAHVMNIIREQTKLIEVTDAMIEFSLNDEQKEAVKALNTIPGIGVVSAEQIIAETGTDMSHFRNQHAFSNWIGVAPGNNESAGKRKSGKTTYGNKTLKSTLTQCAKSAVKNKRTFFSAQYSRLVSHRGKNRATMAVAHSMAIAIYFVISGAAFEDLGADYYHQFNREKKINSHIKQLAKFGLTFPDEVLRTAIELSTA
ncbi:MAG: IS110 family transposase [Oscillospiraceae bacterium]|nr:IS110 family transposase [Oscillospiraceae bacterium]